MDDVSLAMGLMGLGMGPTATFDIEPFLMNFATNMKLWGGFLLIWILLVFAILIAVYVVTSLGWMKLYQKAGAEPAWAAWVPFLNVFALGQFLREETGSPDWVGYLLGLYWLAGLVPVVGTFAVFGLGIFRLVKECQWISRKGGGGLAYVSLFLFPVALPYIMMKQYD